MPKRPTIGDDPLSVLIGPVQPESKPVRAPLSRSRRKPTPEAPNGRKVRATFIVPADLVDDARNAVVALSGPPVRLTLARLVEDALRRELDRLRKAHNRGEAWPARSGALVGGRPIGT